MYSTATQAAVAVYDHAETGTDNMLPRRRLLFFLPPAPYIRLDRHSTVDILDYSSADSRVAFCRIQPCPSIRQDGAKLSTIEVWSDDAPVAL
jgi:hypothetical protein